MTEKIAKLIELIAKLDPTDPAHFTNGKKPKPSAPVLGEMLGESVTAAERDEAWAEYQKQNPPAETDDQEEPNAKPAAKLDSGVVTCEDVIKNLRRQGKRI